MFGLIFFEIQDWWPFFEIQNGPTVGLISFFGTSTSEHQLGTSFKTHLVVKSTYITNQLTTRLDQGWQPQNHCQENRLCSLLNGSLMFAYSLLICMTMLGNQGKHSCKLLLHLSAKWVLYLNISFHSLLVWNNICSQIFRPIYDGLAIHCRGNSTQDSYVNITTTWVTCFTKPVSQPFASALPDWHRSTTKRKRSGVFLLRSG